MIPTFEFLRAQAVTLPLLAKFAIAMAVIVGSRHWLVALISRSWSGCCSLELSLGRMASMSLDRTGRLRSSLQNWERCC